MRTAPSACCWASTPLYATSASSYLSGEISIELPGQMKHGRLLCCLRPCRLRLLLLLFAAQCWWPVVCLSLAVLAASPLAWQTVKRPEHFGRRRIKIKSFCAIDLTARKGGQTKRREMRRRRRRRKKENQFWKCGHRPIKGIMSNGLRWVLYGVCIEKYIANAFFTSYIVFQLFFFFSLLLLGPASGR